MIICQFCGRRLQQQPDTTWYGIDYDANNQPVNVPVCEEAPDQHHVPAPTVTDSGSGTLTAEVY